MAYHRNTNFNTNTTPSSIYAQQNQQLEDELANKVSALKNISINIGNEVKYQNDMLSKMTDDSNALMSMLHGSMNKIKKISKAGGCKSWMLILIFICCTFVTMYFILRLR